MTVTNKHNLPEPLVQAVINNRQSYDFKKGKNRISVTTLLDSAHMRRLKESNEDKIEVDVIDQLHALKGSALHSILEKAGSGFITELRLEMNVTIEGEVYTISGQCDLYDITQKKLYDYKDVKAFHLIYSPNGKREHILQLNILKKIFEVNGLPVENLSLLHFIKDFNKIEKLKRHDYPELPIIETIVPVMSDEELFKIISERIKAHFSDEATFSCSHHERWRVDTYKVMNPKGTRAVTGGSKFATIEEAEEFALEKEITFDRIKLIKGLDRRCMEFCEVNKFCPYWQNRDLPAESTVETKIPENYIMPKNFID